MKYCHVCKKEFSDENDFCPVCEEPLIDAAFADAPEIPPELCGAALRVFMTAANETEAAIVTGLLNASGIPAMTGLMDEGVFLTAYMGYSVGCMEVIVRESDLDAARDVIREAEAEE